jgi:hypothetical protein
MATHSVYCLRCVDACGICHSSGVLSKLFCCCCCCCCQAVYVSGGIGPSHCPLSQPAANAPGGSAGCTARGRAPAHTPGRGRGGLACRKRVTACRKSCRWLAGPISTMDRLQCKHARMCCTCVYCVKCFVPLGIRIIIKPASTCGCYLRYSCIAD